MLCLLCTRQKRECILLCGLQVRKGSFVFDPFAGTGSILVAAAHFGAITLGADIDIRVLRDGKVDTSGKVRASPTLVCLTLCMHAHVPRS